MRIETIKMLNLLTLLHTKPMNKTELFESGGFSRLNRTLETAFKVNLICLEEGRYTLTHLGKRLLKCYPDWQIRTIEELEW